MSYGEDLWSLMGQLLTAQYMRKALQALKDRVLVDGLWIYAPRDDIYLSIYPSLGPFKGPENLGPLWINP